MEGHCTNCKYYSGDYCTIDKDNEKMDRDDEWCSYYKYDKNYVERSNNNEFADKKLSRKARW